MPFAAALGQAEVTQATSLLTHLPHWEVDIRDKRTGVHIHLDGEAEDYFAEIPHGMSVDEIRRLLIFLRSRGLLVLPEHEHPTEYLGDRMRVYLAPLMVQIA